MPYGLPDIPLGPAPTGREAGSFSGVPWNIETVGTGADKQYFLPGLYPDRVAANQGFINLPDNIWSTGTPYAYKGGLMQPGGERSEQTVYGRLYDTNPLESTNLTYDFTGNNATSFWQDIAPLAAFAAIPVGAYFAGPYLAGGSAGADIGYGAGGASLTGLYGGAAAGAPTGLFYGAGGLGGSAFTPGTIFGGAGGAGTPPMLGGGGIISDVLGVGSSLYGLAKSLDLERLGRRAANKPPFDPLGYGARAPWLQQLQALTANPSKITSMPGYQAGLTAVERSMAAGGYLGSGNMMAALAQYGGDFYDKAVAQLAGLAGAGFAPQPQADERAGIMGAGASAELASRALGSLGYLARGWGW